MGKTSLVSSLAQVRGDWGVRMAVIGAKGNFAGPGASFESEEEGRVEITCSQVSGSVSSASQHAAKLLKINPCLVQL